ncbi:MAG: hypothetical protein BGO29_14775 [Bacteroidales bacterium 36-12]|nr:MAG: hypothetical protein BGO29_14775 [Bacteroidales bacterium 36-12]
MKAKVLKKDKRIDLKNDRSLGIQHYGEQNDYPQEVMEILNASCTGLSCFNVYAKFISGRGATDDSLYKKVVNKKGQTFDYIEDQTSRDMAQFGGFCLHVNYNANFKIIEIQYVPFETVRFERLDESGQFDRVAIHPDWGKRFTQLRKWKKEDIEFIHLFNPDPEVIQQQVDAAGGWSGYKGQVYYFSSAGEKTYPLPIFDSVLTDMNTEEGISNVNNRNARNNFLTAGMLIDKVSDNKSAAEEGRNSDDITDTEKALMEFQGDEKALKMIYIQIENDDEKPEFVSFKGENYDKEFTVTNQTIEQKIGKSFSQPPILRAENVGANFGADLMKNAYDFYNSVTENERMSIERVFIEILKYWFEPITVEFAILPLSYQMKMTVSERIGEKGMEHLMKILEKEDINTEAKRKMVKVLFGLNDDELNDLIPG